MHPTRDKMNRALKAQVIPVLRAMGFVGSFPHFRRIHLSSADLLVFQFFSSGGSFVVELSKITGEQVSGHWKADLTLKTATVYDSPSRRYRLGASGVGSDKWFVYGKRNYEPGHEVVAHDSVYDGIANDVVGLLKTDGEAWWQSQ